MPINDYAAHARNFYANTYASTTTARLRTIRVTYLPPEVAQRVGQQRLTDEDIAALAPALALECVLAGTVYEEIDWGAIQPVSQPTPQHLAAHGCTDDSVDYYGSWLPYRTPKR